MFSREDFLAELARHRELRVKEAILAHRRGWLLTPLDGKRPLQRGWTTAPPPDEALVRTWAERGNIGLRTGSASGILVVDIDEAKGADISMLGELPPTVTVETGGGGLHLYFRAPDPCPGNSAGKLAPHVDTRGEGGQVVYPGSVHPVTGAVYFWADKRSPEEIEIAELPAHLLAKLTAKRDVPQTSAQSRDASAWAQAALEREVEAVAHAAPGTRNTTLNTAAFNLGQIVAGGALDAETVTNALLRAALACGLSESEARATIRSGLQAGQQHPRTAPERSMPAPRASSTHDAPGRPNILVPGSHVTTDGELLEIGYDSFSVQVLNALPGGVICRRGGVAGEITGPPGGARFEPLTVERTQALVDRHVRLIVSRSKDGTVTQTYKPCARGLAQSVRDAASHAAGIHDLRLLVNYPVFLPDFSLARPGWNPGAGIYYDEPDELREIPTLTLDEAKSALLELVIDFPFYDGADQETFFGVLLTPLLRPAIRGNTPLFLATAPLERTGKSKLMEQVFGGVILGHPTPTIQLTGTDDERDKRILSLLLDGTTVALLDNLSGYFDSAAVAALLTSRTYSGRLLGQSRILSLPNNLTLLATGNNLQASSELAKRTVPIRLQPPTDHPEYRTDFEHPDLPRYIRRNRARMLGALVALVRHWAAQGGTEGTTILGGFEEWSRLISGVLAAAGWDGFLSHADQWREFSDPFSEEKRAFVEEWSALHGSTPVSLDTLVELADRLGVFGDALRSTSDRGRRVAFSRRVLTRLVDAPVAGWIIRRVRQHDGRKYCLEPSARGEN